LSRSLDAAFEIPSGLSHLAFLLFKTRDIDVSLEKFRHSSTVPHIAMDYDPTIALESVANMHTAADLHVRPRF